MFTSVLRRVLSWLLAGLFVYSGLVKLQQPAVFAETLAAYRLLPEMWVPLAAVVLPGWELGAGLALFFPSWRKPAAAVVAGLCALFLAAMAWAKAHGLDIACGCFGAGEGRIDAWHFLGDAGLLAAAVFCFYGKDAPVSREKVQ